MRYSKFVNLLALLAIGAIAGAQEKEAGQDAAKSFDQKKMLGSWTYVSGARAGVEAMDENLASLVVINEKEFRLSGLPEDAEFVMAYKLQANTSPTRINLEITEGPVPEGKASGIVQFDGDQLVLCYDPTGEQYPGSFESTEDNGYHLFRLKRKAASFDEAKLLGRWNYTSGKRAGEDIPADRLAGDFTVTKDKIEIPAGEDKFVMKYKLDKSVSPVAIDIEIESGPVPEAKAVGIVKMDGDRWTLCYDPTGANRPEKFESTAENGYFLFEIKPAPGNSGDTAEQSTSDKE